MQTAKIQVFFWIIFFVILTIIVQSNMYIVGDNSWLLHTTESLLQGGRYNQDFFETNPPMILYLYIPAVLLHKLSHLNLIISFRIYIITLALISVYICNSLFKKIFLKQDNNIRYVLLVALTFALLLLPSRELGEREHVMMILCLPYIFLTVLRAKNEYLIKKTSFLIGIFAGLGFAIKPYFLITPLLIEIYLALKNKKLFFYFRPETIAIALIIILYIISLFIFTPEYLTQTLPLVTSLYFPGLPISLSQMFFTFPFLGWLFLLCCYLMGKEIQPYREFDQILFLATTGFIFSFVTQRALWYYHWIPELTIATLLLSKILACNYLNKNRQQPFFLMQTLAACFVLLSFTGSSFCLVTVANINNTFFPNNHIRSFSRLIEQYANRKSIYFFYPFVNGAYPLVDYVNVDSSSRFPGLIYLPGLSKKLGVGEDKKTLQEKQWLINAVIEDFYRQPPTLVFISNTVLFGYFNNKSFNYLEFFSSDQRFAKLFTTCYAPLLDIQDFKVYQMKCTKLPPL